MDGAFRPNDLLDLAPAVLEAPAPDCLAATSRGLVVSSDRSLLSIDRPGGARARVLRDGRSALWPACRMAARRSALIDGAIVFVGGQHGGTTTRAEPRSRLHHGARAGCGRKPARRQRLGDERAGRVEARPDGEERVRLRLARRPAKRRLHAPRGRSGLSLWPSRGRRLGRRFGELAQRADADFARRRRSQ